MGDWGAGKPPQAPRKVIHISVVYLLFLLSLFWCFGSPGLPRPPQASPGLPKSRPLGRHRGFRTPRAIGAPARSGATVFFSPRERLERPSARAPPCFSHPESDWITNPLGRHRVFYTPSALGARVVLGFGVWGWNP